MLGFIIGVLVGVFVGKNLDLIVGFVKEKLGK